MIKNLEHYILRFPNVISNKICDDTIKELQNFDWKEHKFIIGEQTHFIIKQAKKN